MSDLNSMLSRRKQVREEGLEAGKDGPAVIDKAEKSEGEKLLDTRRKQSKARDYIKSNS